jgi:UDP-N-acetylglucosamine--N-acetylmuramyl-(pentapeptide) pyrophosphoryl-undecaprenol N-acetylglucosamine transferase
MLKLPTLVQEQNSFPGKTNKLLASKVNVLCTAYDGLDKFFPKEKIRLTGNPVRHDMVSIDGKREEAMNYYGFDSSKKTILIIGGSLGARTLNNALVENIAEIARHDEIQILWQSGKLYYEQMLEIMNQKKVGSIKLVQFIDRMDLAYAAADVIISRAGAISVSELCLIGKPVVLVPSPNVAEDHQTKNAMALVNKNAAILVKDTEATQHLFSVVFQLMTDESRMMTYSSEIKKLAKPNATADIVNELEKIAR